MFTRSSPSVTSPPPPRPVLHALGSVLYSATTVKKPPSASPLAILSYLTSTPHAPNVRGWPPPPSLECTYSRWRSSWCPPLPSAGRPTEVVPHQLSWLGTVPTWVCKCLSNRRTTLKPLPWCICRSSGTSSDPDAWMEKSGLLDGVYCPGINSSCFC